MTSIPDDIGGHPPRDSEDTSKYTCNKCNGAGTVSTGHGKNKKEITCNKCGGTGSV